MNRLIIIGNGFDLAHNMKTSYSDFLLWYLKQCMEESYLQTYQDELISLTKYHHVGFSVGINELKDIKTILSFLLEPKSRVLDVLPGSTRRSERPFILSFKSQFFEDLILCCQDSSWVDIERHYYLAILEILEKNHVDENSKKTDVKRLNDSFQFLKVKLQEYIKLQKVEDRPDFSHNPIHEEIVKWIEYKNLTTLNSKDLDNIDRQIREDRSAGIKSSSRDVVLPQSTMFLNFNYTNTIEKYLQNTFIEHKLHHHPITNYIHGKSDEQIIFGFGDEIDSKYMNLENERDNEFLRFIKSFGYFSNNSYQNLIRFIDSNIFEVYIWGHSCGLSDRTLLNMVFEHENCKSIKIYHHKRADGSTNYVELTQEISRHFKNKLMMRKKIVPFDKNHCLPQITS